MHLSVVIPARNASEHLDPLLSALLPQLLPDDECMLVDDASEDLTGEIARRYGVKVLRIDIRGGPAAARNAGAALAVGDLLVFLDADVVPHADLFVRIREQMHRFPLVSALIGSYDNQPFASSTVSRFRNLLHCFTHHNGDPDASTFWAGCGAIRRAAFQKLDGFDAVQFTEPSIEDIELGVRLKREGGTIRLDPALLVQHRKEWTLLGMVRTDIVSRAIPWTKLILSSGKMPLDLNLKASQRVSGAAVAGACLSLMLLPWAPVVFGVPATVLLAMVIVLNVSLYRFLANCGGLGFAIRCIPLHFLYFLCSVTGYVVGWGQFHLQGFRSADRPSRHESHPKSPSDPPA